MSKPQVLLKEALVRSYSGADRRQSVRFPCDLETICHTATAFRGEGWPARIKDISSGGIGLVAARRFEPGTLLGIDVQDGLTGEEHTLMARVVHAHQQENRDWLLGCAFSDELDEDQIKAFQTQALPTSIEDCRTWVRFPSNLLVTCTLAHTSSRRKWKAQVINVSPGGLALALPHLHERGTLLHLEVPGAGGQVLPPVLARVIHPQQQADGSWQLGCEFAGKLSDEQLAAFL